ncbi:MAG TPA: YhdP family protein [Steroidobacteraceae bacterium]|jgi:uncharacterized protein (TIGR02099 family)
MQLRRAGKIALYGAAGVVGLVVILMLAIKILLDRAPEYQAQIKAWLFQQTGYHVEFASVSPAFRWYGPELYLDRLELKSQDGQRVLARARGGRVGADLLRLALSGKLLAGRIELDSPEISVERLGPDRFLVASEFIVGGSDNGKHLSLDALPSGRLAIRHAAITLMNWNLTLPRLTLADVNLEARHDSDKLEIAASAALPAALGGDVNVRVRTRGKGDLASLEWNGLARLRSVTFQGWRKLLPEYLSGLDAGVGAFQVSAGGSGASILRADLDFAASGVVTKLADGPVAKFDQMSGVLTLTHNGSDWTLAGRRVRATGRDPESAFDVSWRRTPQGLMALSARANYLRAETLLPLTGFLPQKEVRDNLRAIAPTGEWTDALVALNRAGADEPWRFTVRGKFKNAGFASVGHAPGLRGLSGSIQGTEAAGRIALDCGKSAYAWPSQFPQTLELTGLKANLYWSRGADQLLVASRDWQFKTPDSAANGMVSWRQSGEESPLLTLVAGISGGNASNAKNYFPKGLIAPSALEWLNHAFLGGRLAHADALIRGPVRQFPFRDGSGLFLVHATIDGLKLNYAEGWPQAELNVTQAEFRNEGLTVHANAGRVGDLPVGASEARFADFKNGELRVRSSTQADAGQALAYLRASPLDGMAEHAFTAADASGDLEASIDLFLPFNDFDHRRVLVSGHLEGATLAKTQSALKATDIAGDFDIDGAQIVHADLHGLLLGGPFQAQARAARGKSANRTQLEFRGNLSAEALRSQLQLPDSVALSGTTDWRAVLKIAPEPQRERSLRLSSSLSGLALHFPAPLDKPAAVPLPSAVEVQWPAGGGMQGHGSLGSLLDAVFALRSDADGYRLTHLALNFGADAPGPNDAQILNVGGSVERVDLAGWLALNQPGKSGRPLSYYLKTAQIQVAELDYLGLAFHDVGLDLKVLDSGLSIGVSGPNAVGSISVPNAAAEPWNLEFEKLRFEVAGRDDEDDDVADANSAASGFSNPRNIPALDFHAAQLVWGERRFGDVRAVLAKLDDGIELKQLDVTGSTFNVKAVGEWRGSDDGDARIVGAFTSTDVQKTLKDLGYAQVMQAKSGKMDFDLKWKGPPTSAALAGVAGKVSLAFDKGQISGIKPGAGRVLGLTSIATLPRRLSLDFSDLTDKGLAFDTVRGDFGLHDGNAYTDNVLLKGPAAEIGLIGRVGLKNRDYDQTAVVTGSVGNSLPLAALVGGPVVAGAVLVFTQVFKQPLKGLARGYYRITGGWDNPTVERIKGAEAAAATAEAPK